MIPLCFSTIIFAIGKPKPVPGVEIFLASLAREKAVKMLGRVSSDISIPVSVTVKITASFPEVILTFIKPFCGIIYCLNIE